jgi:hypothetical protein
VENDETHARGSGSPGATDKGIIAVLIGAKSPDSPQPATASEQFIGSGGDVHDRSKPTQSATPGAGGKEACGISECQQQIDWVRANPQEGADAQTYREGGVNDTTHRTKKPRRNRDGTRGKRQHKP